MQPKCQVCGQFISEPELWNVDEMECCEKHGLIKICGSCQEIWEKYCVPRDRDKCIIKVTRTIWKALREKKPDYFPRYAYPNCDYISYSFEAAAKHMAYHNHLYDGVGTYPIYVSPKKILLGGEKS